MSNPLFGILTITFCTIGYFFSYKYLRKNNYQIAIFLLIISGLALRIYTSSDFFLHSWDERYHALVAKNLIHHPFTPMLYVNTILPYDYKSWIGNHIWLHKQPLPLWTIALSMWLFGINEIALRIPSIILTTIGIWLMFSIGSFFFNKRIGYLAAFFYSINGLIVELVAGRVATDHIDIFFLFFIELAIFFIIQFVQKNKTVYNVLVGFCMGAAILSKWLPALIILPIWVLIVIDSGRFSKGKIIFHFIILLIASIIIFLPWQIYIFSTFPLEAKWESSFNIKHFTEIIEERKGPFYYYFDCIRINYGDLIYLPLIWFLWKTITNFKNFKYLAISIWFLVPFIFFSFAKTKMQGYILFTSPALFLMTSEFWFMLLDYKIKHKSKWLYNLILLLLIALPIRYAVERIKPFEDTDRRPKWVNNLKNLNNKKIKNGVLFNYNNPIEAMFYTNLTVYREIPNKTLIISLTEKGYTVLINNNDKLPPDIKSIKGVKIENLSISTK